MSVTTLLPLLLGRGLAGDKRITIWGQSNAVGRGLRAELSASPLVSLDAGLAGLDAAAFSRVYIWEDTSGTYQQLVMGTNNLGTAGGAEFGPEFGIAVRWMRETIAGNLYIDKYAVSSQLIAYFMPGGSFYPSAVSRETAARAWLTSHGAAPEHMGWLWVQGEGDVGGGSTTSYYTTQLTTLMAARVTDVLQPANATSVVAMQRFGSVGYGALIEAAQYAVGAADARVQLVRYPGYFNGDNLHLSARGQINLGYLAFASLFSRHYLAV